MFSSAKFGSTWIISVQLVTTVWVMKMFFQLFCEKLSEQTIVGMAIGCRRKLEEKKNLIGSRIIKKRKIETNKSESSSFHYKDTVLDGVAFYWKQDYVSYLSLDDRSKFS